MEKRIITYLDLSKPWVAGFLTYLSTLIDAEITNCSSLDDISTELKSGKDHNVLIVDPYFGSDQSGLETYRASKRIYRDNPDAILVAISDGFTNVQAINSALLTHQIDDLIIIPETGDFDARALGDLNVALTRS